MRHENEITRVLLERCLPYIRRELRTLGVDNAEDSEGEIILKMFNKLLDLNDDTGDFYQVRFWLALERLVADNRRKQIAQIRRESKNVAPSWTSGGEDDYNDNAEPGTTGREPFEMPDMSNNLLIHEALARLKENHRTAFVMRTYCGWPIEAGEPGALTISSYFNKDPRTIRNWLGEADKVLLAWREERS